MWMQGTQQEDRAYTIVIRKRPIPYPCERVLVIPSEGTTVYPKGVSALQ